MSISCKYLVLHEFLWHILYVKNDKLGFLGQTTKRLCIKWKSNCARKFRNIISHLALKYITFVNRSSSLTIEVSNPCNCIPDDPTPQQSPHPTPRQPSRPQRRWPTQPGTPPPPRSPVEKPLPPGPKIRTGRTLPPPLSTEWRRAERREKAMRKSGMERKYLIPMRMRITTTGKMRGVIKNVF